VSPVHLRDHPCAITTPDKPQKAMAYRGHVRLSENKLSAAGTSGSRWCTNGGSIVAESTPGRGATFRIYLPCVAEESAASAADAGIAAAVRPRGHESILLVEDQEQVRELAVTGGCAAPGIRWITPPMNGASAPMLVEKREGPLDLVINDVVMQLMSGPELASRVKRKSPTPSFIHFGVFTR